MEKTPIYENANLSIQKGKIDKEKYLEVYGYKDGVSKNKNIMIIFILLRVKILKMYPKIKNFKVIKGILLVNTEYGLPSDFNPQMDKICWKAIWINESRCK